MSLGRFHCFQNAEIQVLNDHALGELPGRANLANLAGHHLLDYLFSHDFRDFYVFWILYCANKSV